MLISQIFFFKFHFRIDKMSTFANPNGAVVQFG